MTNIELCHSFVLGKTSKYVDLKSISKEKAICFYENHRVIDVLTVSKPQRDGNSMIASQDSDITTSSPRVRILISVRDPVGNPSQAYKIGRAEHKKINMAIRFSNLYFNCSFILNREISGSD